MLNSFGNVPLGIHIDLFIQPHRIPEDEWKEVYKESLQIIKFAHLMDSYRPKGSDHFYAQETRHIDNIYDRGFGGWKTHGSMATGSNMDCFCLFDDIDYYRELVPNDENDHHILDEFLNELEPHGYIKIWDSATNGEDAHIYLLAVACLICDRFPNATHVCGDITCEQMEYVHKWLSLGLDIPIEKPLYIRPAGLIAALREAGIPEDELLFNFFALNLCKYNRALGVELEKEVGIELVRKHYLEELMPYEDENGNTFVWAWVVREYLSLGFDFEMLCKTVMTDIDGCHVQPEDFMRMLLDMKLHLPKPEGNSNVIYYDTSKVPDCKIRSSPLITRIVRAHIPLADIEAVFSKVLGAPFSAAEILQDRDYALPTGGILSEAQKAERRFMDFRERKLYDINSRSELMNYTSWSEVEPTLRQEVIDFFRELQSNYETPYHVLSMDAEGRRDWFNKNYNILITEDVEKEIYLHCNNDEYIRPFIALYASRGDRVLRHVALFNPVFRAAFWELAKQEL